MRTIEAINQVIENLHLLKHHFYQTWNQGELTQAHLKDYAAQYYHQVKSFPRFVSRVHTHCPEIEARKILLSNLVDEEIKGTDHPALWMQFAEGLGASADSVKKEQPYHETQNMVDVYYQLAERDWRDGLCALYTYEKQVPAVSASKIAGLKEHYGIKDEKTLAFFTAHQIYDVEHADQVAHLIDRYVEPEQALRATESAAQALWGFLDGMCRVHNIAC